MSNLLLMVITGLSIGGLYFLLASGLALIFGLMGVLNFAHGAVLTLCGYVGWLILSAEGKSPSLLTLLFAILMAMAVGAAASMLIQQLVMRSLFGLQLEQLLVTVGVGIALVALVGGIWGPDEKLIPTPGALQGVVNIAGAQIAMSRFVIIGAAVLVLVLVLLFLHRTRHGLIIRAAVENREMVQAMGINVPRSFTLVFALAGAIAGLGGVLTALLFRAITPGIGESVLILAFIVLIVGGIGSIVGAAIAAAIIGMVQALANYFIAAGVGDALVVVLLALTLLFRPAGLMGSKERLA